MEQIRQAIERAKAGGGVPNAKAAPYPAAHQVVRQAVRQATSQASSRVSVKSPAFGGQPDLPKRHVAEFELTHKHLEARRIVAHDVSDPRSKSFDMLRTQVLQSMDHHHWQILGITSPTPGCGKTSMAANLALSIARQPDRSVLLIDMDLQRPQVASCLGLPAEHGLLSALEGRTTLSDALIQARIGRCKMTVLPTESATSGSSELMTSRSMASMLQTIKKDMQGWTVIVDLPPVLCSDDVIAILPQIDCVLLVAAAGATTKSEIEECNRHLQSAEVVRLVLNKVPDEAARYYYPK